jgi:hypothetical protein
MRTAERAALLALAVSLAACSTDPRAEASPAWLFGFANLFASCQQATPSVAVTTEADSSHDAVADSCVFTGKGECSLRDAVRFANLRTAVCGGSRNTHIALPPGTYTLSQRADRALEIEGEVLVHGQGRDVTFVEGGPASSNGGPLAGSDSVFRLRKAANLFVEGLTIRHGNSRAGGGGIDSEGTLQLLNCAVADNRAAEGGGGIAAAGPLALNNAIVTNNVAGGDGGGVLAAYSTILGSTLAANSAESGGGLFNRGIAQIGDSRIADNTARVRGGGVQNAPFGNLIAYRTRIEGNQAGADGGGIANARNGRVNLSASVLADNKANHGNGGGLYSISDGLEPRGSAATGSEVTLIDTTVSGNRALADDTGHNGAGGGIYSTDGDPVLGVTYLRPIAELSLRNSVVTGNRAVQAGGIANQGAESRAYLEGSQITDNTGDFWVGGVANGGVLEVRSSTISGNRAAQGGGGLLNAKVATLTNCTISGNSVSTGGAGGIFNTSGGKLLLVSSTVASNSSGIVSFTGALAFTVRNTIVADSTPGPNCEGVVSEDYNLDSGSSCGFAKAHDVHGTDPLLGPLAINAPGQRPTHALLAGSPAIDAGGDGTNLCPGTDARGVARPQGAACDIGAFEREP